jgi:hypothetical protein
MIARDSFLLAWTLRALAPDPCILETVGNPLRQNAVTDSCRATCQQVGMADGDAQIIGEALAGDLHGWCGRDAQRDAQVGQAQAVLNLGASVASGPRRPSGHGRAVMDCCTSEGDRS